MAWAAETPRDATGIAFFEAKIRPVLIEHCYKCHSPDAEKLKGGLRVDFRDGLLKGGKTGAAIVAGDPAKSLLLQALQSSDEDVQMPPKKKLTPEQIADVEKWIQMGAPDPRDKPDATVVASKIDYEQGRKFWSFKPPAAKIQIPAQAAAQNPVDAFIGAKLKEKGLASGTPADKRTLIRRVSFDLLGLPPVPDEIDAFVKDASPDAYAKLIERLLSSPHYGERWGRHWLDVARYADTAGENSDFPIPQAYLYRNYVIQAFNQDKPYDQFLREQIAGDLLTASGDREKRDNIIATGFVALSRRFGSDKKEAPVHLIIEDTLDTIGRSVMGLSMSCARCHDHKFDPISTADYYSLYGIFESTRYPFPGAELNNRQMDLISVSSAVTEKQRTDIEAVIAPIDKEIAELANAKKAIEKEIKTWSESKRVLASGGFENGGKQNFSAGKGGETLASVEIKAGEMLELLVFPKKDQGADSTTVELEIAEVGGTRRWNVTSEVLAGIDAGSQSNPQKDTAGAETWHFYDAQNGYLPFATFDANTNKVKGLYIWKNSEETPLAIINANSKPAGFTTVMLPARAVAIHPSPKGPAGLSWVSAVTGRIEIKGTVSDADASGGDGVDWTLQVRPALGSAPAKLKELVQQSARVKARRDAQAAKMPVLEKAYAVAEAKPTNVHIHKRGDPKSPGPEVPRGFLKILGGQQLPKDAGSGRLELAQWLTEPSNPLTARVMVNRIWQHHFGAALVKTPNDFGTRGATPSHPELLDYLAQRFVQDGWSIKKMHRLIMSSRTYQLASADNPKNAVADPANEWLWKFNRQRLDAESIRDAMLAVSGALEAPPEGAHPFPAENTWTFTQHVPFLAVYDSKKRSVYLMQQRIKKHPFLALFDGADPNATTGLRSESTTPIQALYMMNDPFVHDSAARFAARLIKSGPTSAGRIELAHQLALGRSPSADEIAACELYLKNFAAKVGTSKDAEQNAWISFARALLSSNEFLYVD